MNRRSLILVSLVALLAGGGGAALWLSGGGGETDRTRSTPTPVVATRSSDESAVVGTRPQASRDASAPARDESGQAGMASAIGAQGSQAGAPPPAGGAAPAPSSPKPPASPPMRGPGDPSWDRSGRMAAPEPPKESAKFTWIDSGFLTLDPAKASTPLEERIALACFEPLTAIDPNTGKVVPAAAESW